MHLLRHRLQHMGLRPLSCSGSVTSLSRVTVIVIVDSFTVFEFALMVNV